MAPLLHRLSTGSPLLAFNLLTCLRPPSAVLDDCLVFMLNPGKDSRGQILDLGPRILLCSRRSGVRMNGGFYAPTVAALKPRARFTPDKRAAGNPCRCSCDVLCYSTNGKNSGGGPLANTEIREHVFLTDTDEGMVLRVAASILRETMSQSPPVYRME
jgi:hypothetical protein